VPNVSVLVYLPTKTFSLRKTEKGWVEGVREREAIKQTPPRLLCHGFLGKGREGREGQSSFHDGLTKNRNLHVSQSQASTTQKRQMVSFGVSKRPSP